ncbi:hypothetical protein [Fusibacter sp. A1]
MASELYITESTVKNTFRTYTESVKSVVGKLLSNL